MTHRSLQSRAERTGRPADGGRAVRPLRGDAAGRGSPRRLRSSWVLRPSLIPFGIRVSSAARGKPGSRCRAVYQPYTSLWRGSSLAFQLSARCCGIAGPVPGEVPLLDPRGRRDEVSGSPGHRVLAARRADGQDAQLPRAAEAGRTVQQGPGQPGREEGRPGRASSAQLPAVRDRVLGGASDRGGHRREQPAAHTARAVSPAKGRWDRGGGDPRRAVPTLVGSVRDEVGLREVVVGSVTDYMPFPLSLLAPRTIRKHELAEGTPGRPSRPGPGFGGGRT